MLKVLYILPEYPPLFGGGIGTFYGHLLPAVARKGAQVTAIVGSGLQIGPSAYKKAGVNVLPLDQKRLYQLRSCFPKFLMAPDVANHLAAAWSAWEQTRGGAGFDVVECTDWGLFFVPWLLHSSSPPLLVRLHASDGQIAYYDPASCSPLFGSLCQLIEHAILPRSAKLFTSSHLNRQEWSKQLHRSISYCPPPLSIEQSEDFPSTITQRGLIVGRVQEWKGPRVVCKALQILGNNSPEIDWIGRSLVSQETGNFVDTQMMDEFPQIWGCKIKHYPPQPPDKIKQQQKAANFVLIPSEWDVFNYTVVEAMARKALVICSSGAGASDLIEHGVNGFLFQSGDASSLAFAIHNLRHLSWDQQCYIRLNARKTVVNLLDPDKIAESTIAEYGKMKDAAKNYIPSDDLLLSTLSPSRANKEISLMINRDLNRLDLKLLIRHVVYRIHKKFTTMQLL